MSKQMSTTSFEPEEAAQLMLSGKAPDAMIVDGSLSFAGEKSLKKLPAELHCYELDISQTSIQEMPPGLEVQNRLTARDLPRLTRIHALKVGTLDLQGCVGLESLPDGLDVWFLNLRGCNKLDRLPATAKIHNGSLNISGCSKISSIPSSIKNLATLDVSDCPLITELPPKLEVGLWIDVGGSGITRLRAPNESVGLRWRGVAIDYRIAFQPDQLTSEQVLNEKNAERRRVMIERMGAEEFFRQAKPKVLDSDQDAGGKRQLLRVPLEGDEDIVCLACNCPSTGRNYFLRVPPDMKSCHQAAAWMAGFDDPAKYKPVMET
jgi:hypothetical protein